MKRRYRLAEAEGFRRVRSEGNSFPHPLVVLCALPNDLMVSRAGFIVSRRVGNAVVRNLARRRIGEALRLMWDMVEPGWDLVWIARPAINQAAFTDVQDACAHLLRRARLLRTPLPKASTAD